MNGRGSLVARRRDGLADTTLPEQVEHPVGVERALMFEHTISQMDELTHRRSDDDIGRFALSSEPLCQDPHDRVIADRGDGKPVEGTADGGFLFEVVYTANVTNLHNEPVAVSYSSNLETSAIDDVGNRYEEAHRACDDLGPGEMLTCEFVYDVPSTANLVDLQVSAVAHKRFSFAQTEAAE